MRDADVASWLQSWEVEQARGKGQHTPGYCISILTRRIGMTDPIADAVVRLPEPTKKGYLQQSLCIDSIRRCLLGHRLG